jgi:hypothetical protein
VGRSFFICSQISQGKKSQARVSAAKLRIGSALCAPWQFAGEDGCGEFRTGSALRNSGQFAAGGGCGPQVLIFHGY